MKSYLTIIICIVLFLGAGCSSNQYKAPEGVRQSFYDDMIECIKLAEKTLETKNKKYISEIAELIKKHSADNIFEIIYGLEEIDEATKNNYGLSEKEIEILMGIFSVCFSLTQYMQSYFEGDCDVNKLIDIETIRGKRLLLDIQEAVSIMELDYEFKNR